MAARDTPQNSLLTFFVAHSLNYLHYFMGSLHYRAGLKLKFVMGRDTGKFFAASSMYNSPLNIVRLLLLTICAQHSLLMVFLYHPASMFVLWGHVVLLF